MVLSVVGIDTLCCHNDLPVSLIGINGRHANAGMCVNSGENQRAGRQSMKHLVELRTKTRAVSLLKHYSVCWSGCQL
jgi:hypothetical protein